MTGQHARRSIAPGAALATGAQALTAAALGAIGIVVARMLGPDGAGPVNVAISGIVLLTTFSTLGVGLGLTYHVSRGRWPGGTALRDALPTGLTLGLAGAGVGALVALAVRDSVLSEVPTVAIVFALACLPFAVAWTFGWSVVLGEDRYEMYAGALAGQALLALAFVIVLAAIGDVEGAIGGFAGSYVVACLALYAWERSRLDGSRRPGSRERLRQAAAFGLRASAANAVFYLMLRADLFILSAYASASSVGHYAIALSLTEIVLLLPRSLSAVLMPRVASLTAGASRREQEAVAAASIRHAVLLSTIAAVTMACALPLVPLIYGEAFEESIRLCLLLLPGAAALGVANVLTTNSAGRGHPEYGLYATAIGTPIAVGAYLVVVPDFGAPGAAIVSSASYVFLLILCFLFFRRATGLRALRPLLPRRSDLLAYRDLGARALRRVRP